MEVLFLYWCINFTILWCCKVTYYNIFDIKEEIEAYKRNTQKQRKSGKTTVNC